MIVSPWLTQFSQNPNSETAITILQVSVIILGITLLIEAELLVAAGENRGKTKIQTLYTGILPLLIVFVFILAARFLRLM